VPSPESRDRWTPEVTAGWGVRLGLGLVKGIGEQQQALLDSELARGPYRTLVDVVERTGLPEEVLERLIRTGAMDSLGRPRRELLWQLREVAGASRGRSFKFARPARRVASAASVRASGKRSAAAGRPMDLRLPATTAPELPAITESERLGDAYAVLGLDAKLQAVALFRDALDRLGAVPNAALADRRPGPVRLGGLVVTRQHPMTAKGTVFLALEDETGMVNVTLWPDTWARLRSVVRRHALLLVDGDLPELPQELAPRSPERVQRAGADQPLDRLLGQARPLDHVRQRDVRPVLELTIEQLRVLLPDPLHELQPEAHAPAGRIVGGPLRPRRRVRDDARRRSDRPRPGLDAGVLGQGLAGMERLVVERTRLAG
jgi:DNA polymerase III alpha subunit